MKTSIALIAFAAASSFAGNFVVGGDVQVGYNLLSIGDSAGGYQSTANASFGFAVGPTLTYNLDENFALVGKASFLYDINRYERTSDLVLGLGTFKQEVTVNAMNLGLQVAPTFRINQRLSLKLGYEWDMPLGGSRETKTTTTLGPVSYDTTRTVDLVWAPSKQSDIKSNQTPVVSTHNLIVGAAVGLMPSLELTIQGKFGLNGPGADYKDNGDFKGASSLARDVAVRQLAVGLQVSFL